MAENEKMQRRDEFGILLTSLNKSSDLLFEGRWTDSSAWQCLTYLAVDISDIQPGTVNSKLESAFFYSVLELINFDLIREISLLNNSLIKLVLEGQKSNGNDSLGSSKDLDEVHKQLDLSEEGKQLILEKISSLSSENQRVANDKLRKLAEIYSKFKADFQFIAAALLYFTPENTPGTLEEFKKMIVFSHIKLSPSLVRYLAQSFYATEMKPGWKALEILNNINFSEQVEDKDLLSYVVLIYLAFSKFYSMTQPMQESMVRQYSWPAINFNLPLREMLKPFLADQPEITLYLSLSGSLAESLFGSKQVMFTADKKVISVGQFLKDFQIFSSKNNSEDSAVIPYVENTINKYNLLFDKNGLVELITLYRQLRDCNLVDYRGLLSDQDDSKKYNWREVLENDIQDFRKGEIINYISFLHSPLRVRIEIITALKSLDWENEPYLSRALVLNEIYQDLYENTYGPLIYYEEDKRKWKLNIQTYEKLVDQFVTAVRKIPESIV